LKCAFSEGGGLLRESKWIRGGVEDGKRYVAILRLAFLVEDRTRNGYRVDFGVG